MNRTSQPLVFLAAVLGFWTVGRVAVLAPDWRAQEPGAASAARPDQSPPLMTATAAAHAAEPFHAPVSPVHRSGLEHRSPNPLPHWALIRSASQRPVLLAASAHTTPQQALPPSAAIPPLSSDFPAHAPPAPTIIAAAPLLSIPSPSPDRRLAGSAWLLLRDDAAGAALAPGGTLGGSQAGLRATYRLNRDSSRPLALSARAYLPVRRPAGAEAAIGLDWRPVASLPIHILAERRQAIGSEGRSDFSLTAYGGIDRPLANGRLRLEAYGQAGVVGTRRPDLFADGAARLTTRAGPLHVGGGAWGGAQPGAQRLDIGPHASLRVPVGDTTLSIAAEWRFRIAGDAAPASGPALTVATDF